MRYFLIFSFILSACGSQLDKEYNCAVNGQNCSKKEDHNSNKELEDLKAQVFKLEGTISEINAFVANDFSSCSNTLPTFEKKICQIAQTATAEQQIVFVGQLQEITKIFQNELFGTDCINKTDLGCPVAGSITERLVSIETDLTTAQSDISDLQVDLSNLQVDVSQLQTDLSLINARLNNFNGSGNSIEAVLNTLQGDLSDLNARVNDIEGALGQQIYKTELLCGDNSDSGPAFEPILVTGDNTKVLAYVVSGTANGMGIVAEAGVSGTKFLTTKANTKACKFKIYDRTTTVKVCWKNDNRNASSAQIDTACNAPSFAAPLTSCTCVN